MLFPSLLDYLLDIRLLATGRRTGGSSNPFDTELTLPLRLPIRELIGPQQRVGRA